MPGRGPSIARPGVASIVAINHREPEQTIACLGALAALDWPVDKLEVICVDNGSRDDSVSKIRSAWPNATLVESPVNAGRAGGCNLGAAHATGEYVAFLSNDARPHPRWLAAAVAVLQSDPSIGCVASKVLDWEGENVRYVDGGLTWFGMGFQPYAGLPDRPSWGLDKDVLFATNVAMVVRADLYRDVGGFDERYFMLLEDVDFGWRLNLLGHRVRYVAASIAYHRGGRCIEGSSSLASERFLLERNALLSLYKNADDTTLARVLAPAMALSVRRCIALGGADPTLFDPQRSDAADISRAEAPKLALAGSYAIDYLVEHLSSLDESRQQLQSRRVRSDSELAPLFREPLTAMGEGQRYLAGYAAVLGTFDIPETFVAPPATSPPEGSNSAAANSADPLFEPYRAVAAERAVRSTQLRLRLHDATMLAERTQEKLEQARATNESLRQRLQRLQHLLQSAERKLAEARRPPKASVQALGRVRRGVRMARKVVRRSPTVGARRRTLGGER